MGGNNAWKKRVAMGGLMKGAGGAALRHHPHLGRKGKEELKLNRLGNIGGRPNPKNKQQNKRIKQQEQKVQQQEQIQLQQSTETMAVVVNDQPMITTTSSTTAPIINDDIIMSTTSNNDNNNNSCNINNRNTNKSIGEKKISPLMQVRKANMTNKRLLSWKYRSIGFGCIIAFL